METWTIGNILIIIRLTANATKSGPTPRSPPWPPGASGRPFRGLEQKFKVFLNQAILGNTFTVFRLTRRQRRVRTDTNITPLATLTIWKAIGGARAKIQSVPESGDPPEHYYGVQAHCRRRRVRTDTKITPLVTWTIWKAMGGGARAKILKILYPRGFFYGDQADWLFEFLLYLIRKWFPDGDGAQPGVGGVGGVSGSGP